MDLTGSSSSDQNNVILNNMAAISSSDQINKSADQVISTSNPDPDDIPEEELELDNYTEETRGEFKVKNLEKFKQKLEVSIY